jgi:hypothetical protein
VRERAENMLPNTPAATTLLSSETLNVVTPTAHSVGAQELECESGAENESECDGEEDDDDSDDDLEIVGKQSGTADSTGASSAGTEASAKFYDHPEIRDEIQVMKTESRTGGHKKNVPKRKKISQIFIPKTGWRHSTRLSPCVLKCWFACPCVTKTLSHPGCRHLRSLSPYM